MGLTREMEQGFLNKTSKISVDKSSSLLSDLASKVKNRNTRLLGKDGKPLMPHRYVSNNMEPTSLVDDRAGVMGNHAAVVNDNGEVGCSKHNDNVNANSYVAAGTTREVTNISTTCVGSKATDEVIHVPKIDLSKADVVLPQDEVETISA